MYQLETLGLALEKYSGTDLTEEQREEYSKIFCWQCYEFKPATLQLQNYNSYSSDAQKLFLEGKSRDTPFYEKDIFFWKLNLKRG